MTRSHVPAQRSSTKFEMAVVFAEVLGVLVAEGVELVRRLRDEIVDMDGEGEGW